jgi:hypothetical protein
MTPSGTEDLPLVDGPRCLHGATWKHCVLCARTTWCEDCGDRIVLDEVVDPRESVTCESCVDQMIHVPAMMVDGRYVSRRHQRVLELAQRGTEARGRR